MTYFIIIVVGFVSWFIGLFAFAQIVGSLRTRQKKFIITIMLWLVVLAVEFLLVKIIVPDYIKVFYIGSGISFLVIVFQKKIE